MLQLQQQLLVLLFLLPLSASYLCAVGDEGTRDVAAEGRGRLSMEKRGAGGVTKALDPNAWQSASAKQTRPLLHVLGDMPTSSVNRGSRGAGSRSYR